MGRVPARIDFLQTVPGLDFAGSRERRVIVQIAGVSVHFIGRDDLLINKRIVGRPQDLRDFVGPRVHVTGFVESASPIQLGPGAIVDQGIHAPSSTAAARSFTIDATFPSPTAELRVGPNRTATIVPGAYEGLDAGPKSTVRLSSGRYHFGEVQLGPETTLEVDDTNGEVVVFVGGSFRSHGRTSFSKGPERFAIILLGSGSVDLQTSHGGTVLAPTGNVRLGPGGSLTFEGAFLGQEVDVGPYDTVKLRTFEGWGALLCDKATGPTIAEARTLPTTCTKAEQCCTPTLQRVELGDAADSYDVSAPNTCVVSGKGDDRITGCKMSGSFVLGGEGNDDLQLGQGVVAYGGPGDDRIESFGNATLFGNDGDDVLIAQSGTNVIMPGPGKDEVQTGGGSRDRMRQPRSRAQSTGSACCGCAAAPADISSHGRHSTRRRDAPPRTHVPRFTAIGEWGQS
jgi:hypothetical protein